MSTVRIVGGAWRRTPVPVPDRPGLRPTPDRVRETLFNWLGQAIPGWRVLDAFAGSGALGLEAASRGAGSVVMVESDRLAARTIERLLDRLRDTRDEAALRAAQAVDLRCGDIERVLAQLAREGRRFDLVLLDPPFGQGWPERIMPALAPLLDDGAKVYVESEDACDAQRLAAPGGRLTMARRGRAGRVHYHLFDYRSTL